MLTEEVDEGLVLLGKVLGWDPIDLTYASLLETRDDGFIRWDNKRVKKAPKTESLSAKVRSACLTCIKNAFSSCCMDDGCFNLWILQGQIS